MAAVGIMTPDGFTLEGNLVEHPEAIRTTVIHGATGVPYQYYLSFAEWLSERSKSHILIYGYRDSGDMPRSQRKSSKATMADWGVTDQSTTLDWMLENYPDLPLHTIGHSLGGFCIPFHENRDKIMSHTAVNSGPAWWLSHPLWFVPLPFIMWFLLGPLSVTIRGYFPGFYLGMKTDLPKEVYWQWRRWCVSKNFYEVDWGKAIPKPNLDVYQAPLRLVTTSDDIYIPPKQVRKLARYFPKASIEHKTIVPAEFGLKKIGHIAIFSKRNKAAWPAIVD